MKKVLFVTNLPAPYKIDFFRLFGLETDLTVVFERKQASDRDKNWKSEKKGNYKEIFLKSKNIGNESSFSLGIIPILMKNRYDIVIMNGYNSPTEILTILYMKIFHIKYAVMCDGILPGQCSFLKYKLKNILIKSAFFYLSSGNVTDNELIKYGADKSKIFRYPFSSVSKKDILNSTEETERYKKYIGCKEKKMVLYVGRDIPEKGIDVLLKAFNKIKTDEMHLYMVGVGVNENNDNITSVDFKSKDELRYYYQAADVLVLPTRGDTWGLVLNESMSYGLPVITTDKCVAGLSMIKNSENGYIIQSDNVDMLADTIEKVLYASEINILRQKALETARKWTVEEMAVKTVDALNKMI